MGNGERLQQCSTKPLVYRVPPKEIQGHGTDLIEDLACHFDRQPIKGDQEYGHSTEVWGLGWSDPQ